MDANLRGDRPISTSGYRISLAAWLQRCETRDELGRPAHITPHQFRHTLGTRLINKDVPQEIVRQILDHTSAQMTGHYARLSDTTVRRHWEKARKVNAQGETVALDPAGPLAEAAWAKQRLSRATQALPNGYCGLPVVQSCPHANSCLTCPVFITTADFLPQHLEQRRQTLQIISAAEAHGQNRLVEMNQQVADNLEKIITSLEDDGQSDTGEGPPMSPEPNTAPIVAAARKRHELTRAKAIQALRELDRTGAPVTFEGVARLAGISRSWLYGQPDIRAEIERLRDASRRSPSPPIPTAERSSDASLHARLEAALERSRQLTEENQRLRRQLAHALGDQRASARTGPEPRAPHRSSVTIGPC